MANGYSIQLTDAFVTLATVNLDNIVRFYTQLLGMEPTTSIPDVYAEFRLPNLKLGIFKPKSCHFSEFETSDKSKMSLCLEVSDLESTIAYLATLGYRPPGEIISADHGKEIYAYDPDGNRIILHQSN